MIDLSLYLVTDSNGIEDNDFYRIIDEAVCSGVSFVQLREKTASSRRFFEKALKIKEICDYYKIAFVINDRIDIALAVNADGVHLGEKDIPISSARKILGEGKIIGATAKTIDAAKSALKDGADYFGIGAFFATGTKSDARLMTIDEVRKVTSAVNAPFVGIGGLNENNIDILSGSGVCGAAISSAIMRAENVVETVIKIKNKLQNIL